jgi:hypothetical protein
MHPSNEAVAQLVAQNKHDTAANELNQNVPNQQLIDNHNFTVRSLLSFSQDCNRPGYCSKYKNKWHMKTRDWNAFGVIFVQQVTSFTL